MNMCECMSRLLPSRLLRVKESIYIYIYKIFGVIHFEMSEFD